MNDQNVKLNIAPNLPMAETPEKDGSALDSYKPETQDSQEIKLGPGISDYSPADPMLSSWKATTGASKAAAPGAMDEAILNGLGPWCAAFSDLVGANRQPSQSPFNRLTPAERIRLKYESTIPPNILDLKKHVQRIPSFSDIYQELPDTIKAREFFVNRLGMLTDLIKNAKNEIKKQKDPRIVDANRDMLEFCLKKATFVRKQLRALHEFEKSLPDPEDFGGLL